VVTYWFVCMVCYLVCLLMVLSAGTIEVLSFTTIGVVSGVTN
jgi:hypothetical protein